MPNPHNWGKKKRESYQELIKNEIPQKFAFEIVENFKGNLEAWIEAKKEAIPGEGDETEEQTEAEKEVARIERNRKADKRF